MVMSMTGYGISEFHLENTTCIIEVKTVNSRYLDIVLKLPRSLQSLEMDMKQLIQQYFSRGRIELFMTVSGSGFTEKELFVDEQLLQTYIHETTRLANTFGIKNDISILSFIHHEDIFSIQEKPTPIDLFQENIFRSMKEALTEVKAKRESEGIFLRNDIIQRVEEMENMLQLIQERAYIIIEAYRLRIKDRIEQYIGEEINVSETNILQEIALLAEKGDITEEITRLQSHFQHFSKVLHEQTAIGRKLDFINQEVHREINTIGSKSIDPLMSELVVTMKSENEKIKEQIQNIE